MNDSGTSDVISAVAVPLRALDSKLRRERDPTKRMQIAKLMELLDIGAPGKDIQRQLEVMGS